MRHPATVKPGQSSHDINEKGDGHSIMAKEGEGVHTVHTSLIGLKLPPLGGYKPYLLSDVITDGQVAF